MSFYTRDALVGLWIRLTKFRKLSSYLVPSISAGWISISVVIFAWFSGLLIYVQALLCPAHWNIVVTDQPRCGQRCRLGATHYPFDQIWRAGDRQ